MKSYLIALAILFSLQLQAQEIEVLHGSPAQLTSIKAFELEMVFEDIHVKDNGTEEDLKEKVIAELERESEESGEDWLKDWEDNKKTKYPSKFSRSYTKVLYEPAGQLVATRSYDGDIDGKIVVQTETIGLGFHKGRRVENSTVTAVVSFYNESEDLLFQVRVKDCPGMQNQHTVYSTRSPWYSTFERIGESYAKLGKEVAIYIYESEYKKKKKKKK